MSTAKQISLQGVLPLSEVVNRLPEGNCIGPMQNIIMSGELFYISYCILKSVKYTDPGQRLWRAPLDHSNQRGNFHIKQLAL